MADSLSKPLSIGPNDVALDRPRLKPKPAREHHHNGRFITVMLLFAVGSLACFAAVAYRVHSLQTSPPEPIAKLTGTQYSALALQARRGAILDRHGAVLAFSRPRHVLFIDPGVIPDAKEFARQLHQQLGYDPLQTWQLLNDNARKRYVVLDRDLNEQRRVMLEHWKPRGLGTHYAFDREYPNGPTAGQLIGFVGTDGRGLEGLELLLDSELSGEDGLMQYRRDAARRPVELKAETYRAPSDGMDRQLSIDLTLQRIAERALAEQCEQYNAKAGQVVVMAPETGEILAMANWPVMDPNHFADFEPLLWRNQSVEAVFEPGSIFKPLIWSLLTEDGHARAEETIFCQNGAWRTPFGRTLHDSHGYGDLTWKRVLVKSSNIGMGKVAMRAGVDWLQDAVNRMGFGRPTDSRLPGEVGGLVTSARDWTLYSQTSVPMGQEVAVTPLQITRAYCALANGGWLVTPTIYPRDTRYEIARYGRRVLSPQTSELTRRIMREVVLEGTGRRIKDCKYDIFGKTGTAQIARSDGPGFRDDANVTSFVGGAPLDQPALIVGCFIHEPKDESGSVSGGKIAAPVVKRIVEESLDHLGYQPNVER